MVRMIALDLDNTLLTREGTLSARTLAALREAMARGVLVVLASGRMVEAMRNLAEEIPVNRMPIGYQEERLWLAHSVEVSVGTKPNLHRSSADLPKSPRD